MIIAGVDEVGRGPLAGPVVTAAVVLPESFDLPGLTDSKKLTAKKREMLSILIKQQALAWSMGDASVDEIDELNILQATMLAMQRAVSGLSVRADKILRSTEIECLILVFRLNQSSVAMVLNPRFQRRLLLLK